MTKLSSPVVRIRLFDCDADQDVEGVIARRLADATGFPDLSYFDRRFNPKSAD
jgi:hypothetical protein